MAYIIYTGRRSIFNYMCSIDLLAYRSLHAIHMKLLFYFRLSPTISLNAVSAAFYYLYIYIYIYIV